MGTYVVNSMFSGAYPPEPYHNTNIRFREQQRNPCNLIQSQTLGYKTSERYRERNKWIDYIAMVSPRPDSTPLGPPEVCG